MRTISKALATGILAALFVVGCTAEDDPNGGAVPDTWELQDPSATSEVKADPSEVVVPGESNVIEPAAGCSFVEWCQAPGADGSRCRQQACTLSAAIAECEAETRQFCGTPQCPWIFVALNGTRFFRTPCP